MPRSAGPASRTATGSRRRCRAGARRVLERRGCARRSRRHHRRALVGDRGRDGSERRTRSDRGEVRELRTEILAGDTLDVGRSDAVDDRLDLLYRSHTTEEELLPREPSGYTTRVLKSQFETALREIAHALDLRIGHDLVAESGHLSHDRLQHLGAVLRREARVDDEVARVGVVRLVTVDVVRETALFAELEEQPARHPFAKDRVHHVDAELIGMGRVDGPPSDAEIRLLGTLAEELRMALSRPWRRLGTNDIDRRERAQSLVDRGDGLVGTKRTREGNHRA